MVYITLIARLLAALLGTPDFEESWACWERGNQPLAHDPYLYVCMYDGVPVDEHLDEQNDPRQVFVGQRVDGHIIIQADWWER